LPYRLSVDCTEFYCNLHCPQVTLTVNADGSADLKLVDIKPLVFVEDLRPASFFLPPVPRKLLVSCLQKK
jgi:hypothetical protein